MLSTGVDIVEVPRIENAVNEWGDRFLNRIYTETELTICKGRPGRLAARFSGKEAVMKVLGTGIRGIGWKEIEISTEPSGKPVVNLYGKALAKAESLGMTYISISLSDTEEHAVAFAVGEIK
ncbi:MAG: holo-ACP synthase [Dehalococcoidales bacterium]|nr:holo-ACP synthase [Dehalococcoidales bacterium]